MMSSNDGLTGANGSDVSSDSANASDLRNMNINGHIRPSSPAKRSLSERDKEDGEVLRDITAAENGPARSPKASTSLSQSQITSPLPNRTKQATTDADDSQSTKTKSASVLPSEPLPSLDEQVQQVLPMIQNQELGEGTKAYLVPMSWLHRILSRTTEGQRSVEYPKSAREGEIGPVDTRPLVDTSAKRNPANPVDGFGHHLVPVRLDLQASEDFEFFPPGAWDLVMKWYGLAEGAPVIERFARNTSASSPEAGNYQFELHPSIVTIRKVAIKRQRGLETIAEDGKLAPRLIVSKGERFQPCLKRFKELAEVDMSTRVRLWKIEEMDPTGMPTPKPSLEPSPEPTGEQQDLIKPSTLLLDPQSFENPTFGTRKDLVDIKDETANGKYNGNVAIAVVGLGSMQTLVLEELTANNSSQSDDKSSTKSLDRGGAASGTQGTSTKSSATTSNARRDEGIMTRSRQSKKGKTRGITGLSNLGNTCYMNSALQCIKSVKELTLYFLEQHYMDEINYDNPLGHKGTVAKTYASLIDQLFRSDGSFAPRNFKNVMSRVNPTFAGYGQQDSQEFVGALLDGLHEDLNRIYDKPYIENPDSDDKTVHDPEAIRRLGEQYRANHRKRNESVVVDLFNGWYKGTLHCPVCDKVSVTFDPFSSVTLQLPVESVFQHQVTLFPLRDTPRTIEIDIDKSSNVENLKEYCAKRVEGVKAENLVMAEEYNNKFYRLFQDTEVLSEAQIQKSDRIYMYELDEPPTNWPPLDKKKPKRNLLSFPSFETSTVPNMTSSHADRMAVPVYFRYKRDTKSPFTGQMPFFVLITREEARDVESIYRKLMAKIETMTTRDLVNDTEGSSSYQGERDQQSGEESKKSDDQKVEMSSADGEDDFVDVSLTKSQAPSSNTASSARSPVSQTKSKFLDRSYFIDGSLRSLFDICVYTSTQDVIPCGYSVISENSTYTKIQDRMRTLHRRPSTGSFASRSNSRRRAWDAESASDSGSEDELAQSHASLPAANDPSQTESEEDGDVSMNEHGLSPTPKASRSQRFKQGLKGMAKNMRRSKSRGDDYVLKMGEALILDWRESEWDQMFGGIKANDFKGVRTDENIPTVDDPELSKRRERRITRKKNGATLDDCFDETAKSEVLSEDNAWYCNRCKALRRATKKLELWTVPDILVVHLKRFGSGGRFGRDKVDLHVDFPIDGLNLTGRVCEDEGKSLIYDLFAVDNHSGGIGGGHYTADAKNFFDEQWYEYNDSFVSRQNPQNAITKFAYLLFYRRRTEGPLGSRRIQEMVVRADETTTGSTSEDTQGQTGSSSEATSSTDNIGNTQSFKGSGSARDGGASTHGDAIDEGLGMDGGPDDPLPGYEDSQSTAALFTGNWAFGSLEATAPTNSDSGLADSGALNDQDGASDKPDQGSDLEDRMRDFDDDALQSATDGKAGGEHLSQRESSNDHVEHVPMEGLQRTSSAEEEVAEIRVTDDDGEKMVA